MINKRKLLRQTGVMVTTDGNVFASGLIASSQTLDINPGNRVLKRIFVARFTHETNTFHPVRAKLFNFTGAQFDPSSALFT